MTSVLGTAPPLYWLCIIIRGQRSLCPAPHLPCIRIIIFMCTHAQAAVLKLEGQGYGQSSTSKESFTSCINLIC